MLFLGIVGSFEYRVDSPTETQWNIDFHLEVSNFQFYRSELQKPFDANQEWELTSFKVIKIATNENYGLSEWMNPNQNEYPITMFLYYWGKNQAYIRNVNLMLLVIDG